MKARHFFYIATVMTLLGCEARIGEDLPFEGSRLVILGVLTVGEDVNIRVTKTYPPTGNYTFEGVTNATVSLFENGELAETLMHADSGVYLSPKKFMLTAGNSYHVTVTAPGFPDVQTIPETAPLKVVPGEWSFSEEIENPFDSYRTAYRLYFSFQDEGLSKNYYITDIKAFYRDSILAVDVFDPSRPFDEAAEDICGYQGNGGVFGYDDVCFNGRSMEKTLGVSVVGSLQYDLFPKSIERESDSILLSLRNVSQTYYNYLQETSNPPEGFEQVFIESASPASNVTGGYGLLAIVNEEVIQVYP